EPALLLVLDDLHWADPPSLDLLCHLARQQTWGTPPRARLLILGAYRAGEVAQRPGLERALAELNRLRVLSTLSVGPLPSDDVAVLARGLLGDPLDPPAAALLVAHSEGNPFFAEELLRDWVEAGALVRADAAWRLAAAPPTLPPGIVGAVRQRLARLAPEVVEVLRAAAVIGRVFDLALLAEVLGYPPELVEERLRAAARAHLVRPLDGERFGFGHDRVRECLQAEVTSVRRRLLHGLVGRALEAAPEPPSAQRLAELAFHFGHSGDRARGAAYAQQAAEHALR